MSFIDNVDYWFIDICSNFPVQYALFAFILFLICICKKIFHAAVLAGLLVVFNANVLVDMGTSAQAAVQAEKTFKVYSANINKLNNNLSKLSHELQKGDPEIVLLLEVTSAHVEQIRSVMQNYPHRIVNTSFGDLGVGIVFITKFPILNYRLTKLSESGNAIIEAELEINKMPVMFYGIHAQRPGVGNFDERKEQFIMLAHQISKQPLPVIAAGDLNSTPFTPNFRKLIEISGLRDSRTGFGWQPSWPSYFPLFWIPIDHILVSPEVHVHKRATGSRIGSDHYPVFAELSIS